MGIQDELNLIDADRKTYWEFTANFLLVDVVNCIAWDVRRYEVEPAQLKVRRAG